MANADGSIIIDTELDNSGFEAGSKKLEQSAMRVKRLLESIGNTVQKGLSAAMPSLARDLESVTRSQQNIANAGAQGARATQEEMAQAVSSSSDFAKEMRTLEKSTTSLSGRVSKLGESVRMGFTTDRQLSRFQIQIDSTREKIAQLQQQLGKMGSQKVPTADYAYASDAQEKAEQALLKLYDRREMQEDTGVKENSAAWQRLSVQIQHAEEEVERYKAIIAGMKANGTAFVQGSSTAELQQTAATLQDMSARLAEYEQMAANFDSISAPAQASRAALEAVDSELQQKPTDAENASSALSSFAGVLRRVGSAALTATKNLATAPFKPFTAGIKSAISSLKSFVKQSTRAKSGTSGIKSAISSLKSFVTQAGRAKLGASGLLKGLTSIKTMLFSRMKRMFISAIVNGIQEGIKALAQFSTAFNTSMSNIKNSAKELSANLSVSLGGLIQAIEPVLTRIISAISTAISYLNALFAMLGGKSTVTVAKKQMDSYADAAAGAGGAVKELKRQVYGFDELNKRSSDNGGGGGGSSAADMFEEVPIDSLLPDSIKDLFDRIKAAYMANDWTEIGRVVADGLNMGMSAVDDWITGILQPKAILWAQRIGQLINGLVERTDWGLMGKTLADGFNTVVYFLATAIETIDWRTMGAQLATGVYSLVTNIDLTRILQGVNAFALGFYNFFIGAIQAIQWQQVGAQLYASMKNVFTTLDFGSIASAAYEALGSAFGAAAGLLWGFIKSIGEDAVKLLDEIGGLTMDGLKEGIWNGIKNIGSWIVEHVVDPLINGFCAALGINSPSTVMAEQGEYIVEGLLLGIKNAWTAITSFFSTVLGQLKTTLQKAWNDIKSSASSAWTQLKSTVTSTFESARTALTTSANNLKSSLSSAWSSMKSTATQAWTNIKSSVSSAVSSLKSDTENKINSVKTAVQNAWSSITSATSSAWNSIQSSVTSRWNSLYNSFNSTNWYSVGSNICSGIQNGINAGWGWLSSTVSGLARSLLNSAKSALGIRSPSRLFRDEVGQFISLGIAEGITDTEANVIKAVSNVADSAVDGLESQKINLGVSSGISGLDLVADRLSDIAATFRDITSMLTAMGGLSLPQIAVGSVVPPRTRVAGWGDSAAYPGVSEGNFEEFMNRNNDTLREILEAIRKQKLAIDIDALARAVFTAHRSAERSFGGT